MDTKPPRCFWQIRLLTLLLASLVAGGMLFINFRSKYWRGDKVAFASDNDFFGHGWPLVVEQYYVNVESEAQIDQQFQYYSKQRGFSGTRSEFRSGFLQGMIDSSEDTYRNYKIHDLPGTGILMIKLDTRTFSYIALIVDTVVGLCAVFVFAVLCEYFLRRRDAARQ